MIASGREDEVKVFVSSTSASDTVKDKKSTSEEKKDAPSDHPVSLTLDQVVTKSKLADKNPDVQAKKILDAFNEDIKPADSAFTTSLVRGSRIPPGFFQLGHRNQKPELAPSSMGLIARHIPWPLSGNTIQLLGEPFSQNTIFAGQFGTYLVNVPNGYFVKAWTNSRTPVLLDEGPHVIHDKTFQLAGSTSSEYLVKKSENFIQHGTMTILRVALGSLVKAWYGAQPLLLGPELADTQPFEYICNDVKFRVEMAKGAETPWIHINSFIHHERLHHLRVEAGTAVKAMFGTTPLLLGPGMLDELEKSSYTTDAFKEQLKQIKRELKEVSPGIYECHSPYFSIEEDKNGSPVFYSTNDQYIQHGAIKRIVPHSGEVAITYDDKGERHLITAGKAGAATVIFSNTWTVESFMPTVMQSLLFPSEATRKRRYAENKQASIDEINLEISSTNDSAKIGTKLFVAFEITEPEKALKRFGSYAGIVDHIEKVTAAEMSKQISQRSSRDFWSYTHTDPRKASDLERKRDGGEDFLTPDLQQKTLRDIVEEDLRSLLKEDGINLVRVNLEEVKFLNPKIVEQMEQQAITIAQTSAKEAVMDKQTELAKKQAAQDAEVSRIKQEQENRNAVSIAEAELKAATSKANALKASAQGQADAMTIEAEAKAKAKKVEAEGDAAAILAIAKAKKEASQFEGQVFQSFPEVLERDLSAIRSGALSKATLFVTPKQTEKLFAQVGINAYRRTGVVAPVLEVVPDEKEQKEKEAVRSAVRLG